MKRKNSPLFHLSNGFLLKHLFRLHIFYFIYISSLEANEILKLKDFLKMVENQNLNLKMDAAKSNSAIEKARGISIPPPMMSWVQLSENSKSTAKGFELSQNLPFPTRLSKDLESRKLDSQSQKADQWARRVEKLSESKLSYISFWIAYEKLQILKEKRKILEDHLKLTKSTARSNSFTSLHQLKVETDMDLIENEILSSQQELRTQQAIIASLINKEPSQYLPLPQEPPLSIIPDDIQAENSSQFQSLKLSHKSLIARESEARQSWYPDLSFKIRTMEASEMAPSSTEWMIGISLPFVYPWQPSSLTQSTVAEKMAKEFETESALKNIQSDLIIYRTQAHSFKQQLDQLKNKTFPRLQRRMVLIQNIAPRDLESLQDHRETMESFPEIKLKILEIRFQYESSISKLERYLNLERESYDSINVSIKNE